MKTIVTVKDPVCRMDVDPTKAPRITEYKGQAFHFCGSKCKERFDHDPEQYLGKVKTAPKAGGCCS